MGKKERLDRHIRRIRKGEVMNELDFLVEVYVDYCDKHGLDHVSTCEQSGLKPEQWDWIDVFNDLWDEAQGREAAK